MHPKELFTHENVVRVKKGRPINVIGRAQISTAQIWFESKQKARLIRKKAVLKHLGTNNANGLRQIRLIEKLRTLGLKVPKAGLVKINGDYFIAMEPFLTKGQTKLTPINTQLGTPWPHFLENLTISKNSNLIKNIARDTAIMLNNGIVSTRGVFDFFSFYRRKNGELDRLILDTEELEQIGNIRVAAVSLESCLDSIRRVWTPPKYEQQFQFFLQELKNNLSKEVLDTLKLTGSKYFN